MLKAEINANNNTLTETIHETETKRNVRVTDPCHNRDNIPLV